MTIGIWSGCGKPSGLYDFLKPFISEVNLILRNGIVINQNKLFISKMRFLCDAPARCFLKGI